MFQLPPPLGGWEKVNMGQSNLIEHFSLFFLAFSSY
jgi:hypothetical protein